MSVKTNTKQSGKLSLPLRIMLKPETGLIIPLLILCVVTTIIKPNFLTWTYIASILVACVFIGCAAIGESLVIMVGEIDLSVGFVGTFSGIMMGQAAQNWGLGPVLSILICLSTGALVGFVNGVVSSKLGLISWITTLATQFICNGLAVTISNGLPLSIASLGLQPFVRANPLGLKYTFFLFLALIIIMDIVVRKSGFGYKLRAVGGNKEAALMAGINVSRIKIIAFTLAGLFAAIGGLFDVMASAMANSSAGAGREFRAITCCAIGGISMMGGEGSVFGVGFGVLLFHTLWYCLRILNTDANLQLVLIGIVLIISVILDMQRKRIESRKMI